MLGAANFPSCQHLLQGFFAKIKYDLREIKKKIKVSEKRKNLFILYSFTFSFLSFQKIYLSSRSQQNIISANDGTKIPVIVKADKGRIGTRPLRE